MGAEVDLTRDRAKAIAATHTARTTPNFAIDAISINDRYYRMASRVSGVARGNAAVGHVPDVVDGERDLIVGHIVETGTAFKTKASITVVSMPIQARPQSVPEDRTTARYSIHNSREANAAWRGLRRRD